MTNGMKACPECAEEVKAAAKVCRYCGHRFDTGAEFASLDTPNPKIAGEEAAGIKKFNRRMYNILAVVALAGVGLAVEANNKNISETPNVVDHNGPNLVSITAEYKENRRKGLHCLDGTDGSNLAVVDAIKSQLVDPDSFQHIETTIYPAKMLHHRLVMQFRSRNGFNGMVRGKAVATVNQMDCRASLRSVS